MKWITETASFENTIFLRKKEGAEPAETEFDFFFFLIFLNGSYIQYKKEI